MNRVVHFEIHADDIERAKKFYTDAFGWEVIQMGSEFQDYVILKSGPGADDMAKGVAITIKNVGINGGMMKRNAPKTSPGASPNAYVCIIGVPNIDDAMAKIATAGGKPHTDKMDVPNVGKLRYYEDTEGNIFGVLEPLPM